MAANRQREQALRCPIAVQEAPIPTPTPCPSAVKCPGPQKQLKSCVDASHALIGKFSTQLGTYAYTDTVTSYVQFCEQLCIPTKTVLTNYKTKPPPTPENDHQLPDKLNAFYSRFDHSPVSPLSPPSPPPPPPFIIKEAEVRCTFR
ncbi:hypothetical protein NQZ68_008843 [Dissostichus eleginoides]|nr:hypothetical protein NQZ68_008843 [Dissostichus eleginoides]